MADKNKNNYLWIGIAIVAVIVIAIIFISNSNNNSQNEVTCNSPYIKVGTSCCLDQNSNGVCDSDEQTEEPQTYCGDGTCQSDESCSSCQSDCGICQPQYYCGDGICRTSEESCGNCPQDCGACGECYSGRYSYYACVVGGGDLVYNENTVVFSSELTSTNYGEKCKFLHLEKEDTITFRLDVGAKGELYNDDTGQKEKGINNAYNVNANYQCIFNADCSFDCEVYGVFEED